MSKQPKGLHRITVNFSWGKPSDVFEIPGTKAKAEKYIKKMFIGHAAASLLKNGRFATLVKEGEFEANVEYFVDQKTEEMDESHEEHAPVVEK